MSVDLDVQWRASSADLACTEEETMSSDWKPSIAPELVCQNAYSLSEELHVLCAHGGIFELRRESGMVFFRKRYTGEFFAPFDLQFFPFDIQQLPLVIEMSFLGTDRLWMVPPSLYDYTVWFNREFSVLSNFMVNAVLSDYDNSASFSRFKMTIVVERNWMAYFYRVIVPVLLISGAALLMFALAPDDGVDSRLGFGITLLLTMVAFEFTLAQDLPKDPRLSILDKYVKASFAFQLLVLIAVASVGWRRHGDQGMGREFIEWRDSLDWYFFLASAAVWVFLQLYLIFAGLIASCKTGRSMCGCWKVLCGCINQSDRSAIMVTQSANTIKVETLSSSLKRRLRMKGRTARKDEKEVRKGSRFQHLKVVR